ncbi:Hypothetical protein PMT_2700 [Prochlorococcus marinus str. MIT 9313]|uniref:Uncharacterized protein n=2 Tax=Prochlorococcus marinus TaxID=1219 RepID=B9ES84_PROMM|nr:Hypothetical protein PMT_2700 [Prochlorococcus marinus str. MIT 9313]
MRARVGTPELVPRKVTCKALHTPKTMLPWLGAWPGCCDRGTLNVLVEHVDWLCQRRYGLWDWSVGSHSRP